MSTDATATVALASPGAASAPAAPPRQLLRLVGNGTWAVTDQALFAGSNFMLNVILARWLTPAEFGAFGVAYSVFLLIGTVHTSMLTEPMVVFGSGRYRDWLRSYLGLLLWGHVAIVIPLGAFLLLAAGILWLAGTSSVAWALAGQALAAPLILFLWLVRRACYVRGGPGLAVQGGMLYTVLMLAGQYAAYRASWLSAASAQCVMGVSSLVVGLWLVRRLQVEWPAAGPRVLRQTLHDHWDYGRWAVATQAVGWLPRNIYYILLPASADLAASGALRALMALTLPITHANTALAVLLIPLLVRARRDGVFGRSVGLALGLFTAGGAIYWLLLGLFNQPLIDLLYAGKYTEYGYLLWLVGGSLITAGVIDVLGSALRAMERPDQMFWSNVVSTAAAVTAGLVCMATWGVTGAAIGLFLSSVIKAAVMGIYYVRLCRRISEARASTAATSLGGGISIG